MPNILITTELTGVDCYELIQTYTIAAYDKAERHLQVDGDNGKDRMVAAIINVGHACRWLADDDVMRGVVVLHTDTDGADVRYGGEHNKLYEAIKTESIYRQNRLKYQSFYGDYVRYLDKIRTLANAYEITFQLDDIFALLKIRHLTGDYNEQYN